MKTAIIYYSQHHGNTKKLLDAIASKNEVDLYDVTKKDEIDLSDYDRIGLASGIYYSSVAKQLLQFAAENLPEGKEVFFIATCGNNSAAAQKVFFRSIKSATDKKNCRYLGEYICLGFDTFGPFKLVGGIAKGHPDEGEIEAAVKFYEGLNGN